MWYNKRYQSAISRGYIGGFIHGKRNENPDRERNQGETERKESARQVRGSPHSLGHPGCHEWYGRQ